MKAILILLCCLIASSAWASDTKKINITAKSWLVADEHGSVIEGTNVEAIRSIASITKLMAVIVVLRSGAPLEELLPVKLYNRPVTRQQLMEHALVRSDNTAAKMLCDTYPQGYHRCVIDMNREAQRLGMENTLFTDPTGLYNTNVSTAKDLVKLVLSAATYSPIVQMSNMPRVEMPGSNKKVVIGPNTNPLVGAGMNFVVSKTGYIRDSGGCIVMIVETLKGLRTVILLGSSSIKTRIPEAKTLAERY